MNFSTTFVHTDLIVSDLDSTISYYKEFLGFELVEDCLIEGEVVSFLSNNKASKMRLAFLVRNKRSTQVELIQFLDDRGYKIIADDKIKLNLSLSFLVPDLEEVIAFYKTKGIEPASSIFEIKLSVLGKTRIVFFKDPDGYLIEFISSC